MAFLDHFRTLRFRLTALYVVVFGLIQAALWIAVDVVYIDYVMDRFDRGLISRGQGIVELIESQNANLQDHVQLERLGARLKPFETPDLFFQIRDHDGRSGIRSQNLLGFGFPFFELPQDGPRTPRLDTVPGELPKRLSDASGDLRVATFFLDSPTDFPYYLQVGASLGPLQASIQDVHQLLLTFVLLSLVVAGMTSWLLARRSLEPIGTIARQARKLSAKRLDQRIPTPDTGDEVAELVEVINKMLERLERDFHNQRRFIADVSHELKTPLAVLLGEVQTAFRDLRESGPGQRFATVVEEEVRRMLRSVDSFLILTRARARHRLTTTTPVSVEELVISAIARCKSEQNCHPVRLLPKFESQNGDNEPMVAGDFDLLLSLIENLLHNAIRHSPPEETVEIVVETAPTQVIVRVRDRGPGIPEDQHLKIFDLFYQASPRSKMSGTSGIGLSIAKAVCELHGAEISCKNRLEGGCEFKVVFVRLHQDHPLA